MSPFARFTGAVQQLQPRTAVVLGSGLGGVTAAFVEQSAVAFADIPGLVSPTVHGHGGRLAVGLWAGTPTLVFFGRLHFYEGHAWDAVTAPVRLAAMLGVRSLILTNAAGGIHPSLGPGALMAIRGHFPLLGPTAWRAMAANPAPTCVYSERLLNALRAHGLPTGVYAALTGPSYETPAEIRALAACGADAVGMSTAREAETAAALGLEVAAVSCITNQAAGLGGDTLDHAEVLTNAKLAADRLGGLIGHLISVASGSVP